MQSKQNSKDSSDSTLKKGGWMVKISLFIKPSIMKAYSLLALFPLLVSIPLQVNAGFFDFIAGSNTEAASVSNTGTWADYSSEYNSQTYPFIETSINPDMKNIKEEIAMAIVEEDTLSSTTGLVGTGLESVSTGGITTYIVKEGDTLSQIAEDFDISQNTIRWENDITGQNIRIGQNLSILPVSGVKHIVKKGDTLAGIADKYDAEVEDIKIFNDISSSDLLKVGDVIIVPNGIISVEVVKAPTTKTSISSSGADSNSKTVTSGYYMRPTSGIITSPYGSRHGSFHYGVDIGAKRGTTVSAAASGTVTAVVGSCKEGQYSCGGRYGNYIVIEHPNGQSTRYAHLSTASVSVGQKVAKGKNIGTTGNTGRSTGPHLHFQVEKSNGKTLKPAF